MPAPRLVVVSVAAEQLGVSDETVYRLAKRGAIAYFRDPVTGRWRFVLASIEAYIAANTVPARPRVVEVTPVPGKPRQRRAVGAQGTAGSADAPWLGSIPQLMPASGGGSTDRRAASSAARNRSTRPRDS